MTATLTPTKGKTTTNCTTKRDRPRLASVLSAHESRLFRSGLVGAHRKGEFAVLLPLVLVQPHALQDGRVVQGNRHA
jgi:hypothetical protein